MQASQPSSPIGPREQALNAQIQKYQALLDRRVPIEEKSQAMADAIFDTTCLLFLNIKSTDLNAYAPKPKHTFASTEIFLESPVRQFSTASNMLVDFIKTSTMIRDESSKEQPNIENVKMWLAVADELRKKNDFNSLQNVVSGLVRSVKLCGDALNPEERRKYNEYSDLFIGEKEPFERVRPRVINAVNNGEIVIPQLSMITSLQEKNRAEEAALKRQIELGLKQDLADEKERNITRKKSEFSEFFNSLQTHLPQEGSPSFEERNRRLAAQKLLGLEAISNTTGESNTSRLENNSSNSPIAAKASTASTHPQDSSKSFISRFGKSVSKRFSLGGDEPEKAKTRKDSAPPKLDEIAEKVSSVVIHPEASEATKKVGADTLGRLVSEVAKLTQMKQQLESNSKKDSNILAQISQLSMGISSTTAKIEEMRAKSIKDTIESKIQQNPNIKTEKGGELFQLYRDQINHLSSQKEELGKMIENLRQNMKDNKRSSSKDDSPITDLQKLQSQVDGLNEALHHATVNKIKLSDPRSLPDEYAEPLFNKSASLFTELDKIRNMKTKSPHDIQAQQQSLLAFDEKLKLHKEMVTAFVDNASPGFTKISEKSNFVRLNMGPLEDLDKERATFNNQKEASVSRPAVESRLPQKSP